MDMAWGVRNFLDDLPRVTLEELTLDVTECYGFDGRWLGYGTVAALCDFLPTG